MHLEPGLLDSKPRNTIEVISRSFSIIQTVANQPWRGLSDVLIEPDVHHVLWDEFVKTPQLIAAGADACYASLPKDQTHVGPCRRASSSRPIDPSDLGRIVIFSSAVRC